MGGYCNICIFIRMLYHCYIKYLFVFVIVVCKIMIQSLESLYYWFTGSCGFKISSSPLRVRIIHRGTAVKVKGGSPPSPLHIWNIFLKLRYKRFIVIY